MRNQCDPCPVCGSAGVARLEFAPNNPVVRTERQNLALQRLNLMLESSPNRDCFREARHLNRKPGNSGNLVIERVCDGDLRSPVQYLCSEAAPSAEQGVALLKGQNLLVHPLYLNSTLALLLE